MELPVQVPAKGVNASSKRTAVAFASSVKMGQVFWIVDPDLSTNDGKVIDSYIAYLIGSLVSFELQL